MMTKHVFFPLPYVLSRGRKKRKSREEHHSVTLSDSNPCKRKRKTRALCNETFLFADVIINIDKGERRKRKRDIQFPISINHAGNRSLTPLTPTAPTLSPPPSSQPFTTFQYCCHIMSYLGWLYWGWDRANGGRRRLGWRRTWRCWAVASTERPVIRWNCLPWGETGSSTSELGRLVRESVHVQNGEIIMEEISAWGGNSHHRDITLLHYHKEWITQPNWLTIVRR